jgi:hypothetical protein
VSTDVPGQPLAELFDFQARRRARREGAGGRGGLTLHHPCPCPAPLQRVVSLAPGETATLYFTLPPSVLAAVTPAGAAVLTPGARATLRIGSVPQSQSPAVIAAAHAAGNFVERTVVLTGSAAVVVTQPPLPLLDP